MRWFYDFSVDVKEGLDDVINYFYENKKVNKKYSNISNLLVGLELCLKISHGTVTMDLSEKLFKIEVRVREIYLVKSNELCIANEFFRDMYAFSDTVIISVAENCVNYEVYVEL